MSTATLPKIRTQEDVDAEDVETWKSGGERERLLLMLRSFGSAQRRSVPISGDHDKIARDAVRDFHRNDFSGAVEAIESLVLMVDFYKDLAETYMDALAGLGAVFDSDGAIVREPFVLVGEDGEQLLGRVEVVEFDGNPDSKLWEYYVESYLPVASERERAWIVDTFSERIQADEKGVVE